MSYDYVDRTYAVERGASKSGLSVSLTYREIIDDLGAKRKAIISILMQNSDDEYSANCLTN